VENKFYDMPFPVFRCANKTLIKTSIFKQTNSVMKSTTFGLRFAKVACNIYATPWHRTEGSFQNGYDETSPPLGDAS
jgi:hypothetical protein